MPSVAVPGDRGGLMARSGQVLGISRGLAVWRFGFEPDSLEARVLELWAPQPLWVLTLHLGRVVMTRLLDWGEDPPLRFQHVIEARL